MTAHHRSWQRFQTLRDKRMCFSPTLTFMPLHDSYYIITDKEIIFSINLFWKIINNNILNNYTPQRVYRL